jgi:integrase
VRGSIQKKNKTYYAVIALNGKRRWFRGPSKKEAQRILTDKLKEIDNRTYKEIPEISFNEFSQLWLRDYAEISVKPSTLSGYRDIIKRLLKVAFGNYNLSDITTGNLQTFIADRRRIVSSKTVCNEIVVMKEMFKHAYRWGYLKINPAEYVERPKITKPEIEILTPEEVEKFLSKADNHYKVAFLTDVITGLRAGELWGLKWIDIDWNSNQIHVRRSLWKGNFQTPKSKYSIRKIDMTDSLIQELKRWKLACPVNDHDVVFPSPEGKLSQHDNVIKRSFNRALREAGLRQVSFHSIRHTNASMRITSGQNIKYIQSQLGHASINITLDIYGHLFNDVNFNRHQVGLLEESFKSVRKPLEKQVKIESDGFVNPLPINPLQVVVNA